MTNIMFSIKGTNILYLFKIVLSLIKVLIIMKLTQEQKDKANVYLKRIAHISTRKLGTTRSLRRLKKEIETQLLLIEELVINK